MLPFVASQAIALSRVKQESDKSPADRQHTATLRSGKGFFSRLFDAMAESRRRRAEIEVQRRSRLRGEMVVEK